MKVTILYLIAYAIVHVRCQTGPLTQHFQEWLSSNGYGSDNFQRSDLGSTGSYGGKTSADQQINRQPVIFIHGNSDGALAVSGMYSSGWSNSIQYFQSQGYTSAELYATTWGDRVSGNAQSRRHNCATIRYLRRFVEAVLAYTHAPKVDIISHSMGVTLARKVVKGGTISASDGNCNIGPALTDHVDAFHGMSGGNYGLCSCGGIESSIAPTCNKDNGYWPGDTEPGCGFSTCYFVMGGSCTQTQYGALFMQMNNDGIREGSFVTSAWSTTDDILTNSCNVWGSPTPRIAGENGHKIYTGKTHMQTKETTANDQYNAVVNHQI